MSDSRSQLNELAQRMTLVIEELIQFFEPLGAAIQHSMKAAAPIALIVAQEFSKWNVSSEVLGRAGWLPHYTTPFDLVAKWDKDTGAVQGTLLDYYEDNWKMIRSQIESRLSDYNVDSESISTFHEALDAHEAGLYRCVSRVLFPEIERVIRVELFSNYVGNIGYKKKIRRLLDGKDLGDFIAGGFYELTLFSHLTKNVEDAEVSGSEKFIYGLFENVNTEEDRKRVQQYPVPNRHAAMHGLVVYSSKLNSLNMIFMTDYFFEVISLLRSQGGEDAPSLDSGPIESCHTPHEEPNTKSPRT